MCILFLVVDYMQSGKHEQWKLLFPNFSDFVADKIQNIADRYVDGAMLTEEKVIIKPVMLKIEEEEFSQDWLRNRDGCEMHITEEVFMCCCMAIGGNRYRIKRALGEAIYCFVTGRPSGAFDTEIARHMLRVLKFKTLLL